MAICIERYRITLIPVAKDSIRGEFSLTSFEASKTTRFASRNGGLSVFRLLIHNSSFHFWICNEGLQPRCIYRLRFRCSALYSACLPAFCTWVFSIKEVYCYCEFAKFTPSFCNASAQNLCPKIAYKFHLFSASHV